jgi:hypothetical protein
MLVVSGFTRPLVRPYLRFYSEQSAVLERECCGQPPLISAMPMLLSTIKRKTPAMKLIDFRYYFAIQWTMVAAGSAIGAFIAFGYK